MNLAQLHYFSRLAELQHYSRAAEELHITQPSLSSSISSLEKELGVPLFQKIGRNVKITKYGAEFLEYVNAGLERIDTGIAIMREHAGSNTGGIIDLGCIYTLQDIFLPDLLLEYQTYVDTSVMFNVDSSKSGSLLDAVKNGELDAAFLAKGPESNTLKLIPIAAQKVLVAMNASCPLASKEFIVPSDLEHTDVITYKTSTPIGSSFETLFKEHGITAAHYDYVDEGILSGLAAKFPGKVAVLANTLFLHHRPNLVFRELRDETEHRPFYHRLYMAYDEKRRAPHCVDRFIRHVEKECTLGSMDDNPIFID